MYQIRMSFIMKHWSKILPLFKTKVLASYAVVVAIFRGCGATSINKHAIMGTAF